MRLIQWLRDLFRPAELPEPPKRRRWTRVEDARGQYLHRYLDEHGDVIWLPGDFVPSDEPPVVWRPVEPYNHEDGGDCMMTIQEFIDAVAAGAYTDYDGFGECATATQVSNCRIYPSALDRPSWTTHVCWYNK